MGTSNGDGVGSSLTTIYYGDGDGAGCLNGDGGASHTQIGAGDNSTNRGDGSGASYDTEYGDGDWD